MTNEFAFCLHVDAVDGTHHGMAAAAADIAPRVGLRRGRHRRRGRPGGGAATQRRRPPVAAHLVVQVEIGPQVEVPLSQIQLAFLVTTTEKFHKKIRLIIFLKHCTRNYHYQYSAPSQASVISHDIYIDLHIFQVDFCLNCNRQYFQNII